MKEKILKLKANRIAKKYVTLTDFSIHATKKEKKTLLEMSLLNANKLQKQTARSN